ncbi:MAG: hydrogenase expression/formation protein HypE, partial [Candidatus Omnitrophica bacterium]|nr:hydrogenase expression/formation protein HypE [Candidatus Omnitrophota bacterium]
AVREGLSFESTIESDSAPVWDLVAELLDAEIKIHCMRDLTRGGLASVLNEIAEAGHVGIEINEKLIPVREDVRGACEILGLDPLYVANEGRFAVFVNAKDAGKALAIMQKSSHGSEDASTIGEVRKENPGRVVMENSIGTKRIIDMIAGEQLPRIC